MRENILEVQNLTKKFGDFVAVDSISFSVARGEIVGLLGPNGAGKTTSIQMLLNLMTPTSGSICYFGKDLFQCRDEILPEINYSFGYSNLPWRLTARENLTVYGWLYEVANIQQRIEELAKHFDATHLLGKLARDLSAGELTRILLIKAFINHPKLVLLDEPTASLDPDVSEKIRAFIMKEREDRNMSLLITSHNMAEIEEMCDRVLFLHEGIILEEGTPQHLARKRRQTELHLMVSSGKGKLDDLVARFNLRSTERKNYTVVFLSEASISSFLTEAGRNGIEYSEIEIVHPSLEDFFIDITKERAFL